MSELPPNPAPLHNPPQETHLLSYLVSWAVIIGCVGFIMWRVNGAMIARSHRERAATTAPAASRPAFPPVGEADAPDSDNLDLRLISRVIVATKSISPQQSPAEREKLLKNVDGAARSRED